MTLGLCTQTDLDAEVKRAAAAHRARAPRGSARGPSRPARCCRPRRRPAPQPAESEGYTPTVELVHPKDEEEVHEETPAEEEARVFAKLKELKSDPEEKDEDAED